MTPFWSLGPSLPGHHSEASVSANMEVIYATVSVLFYVSFVECRRTEVERKYKTTADSPIVFPETPVTPERQSKEIPLELIQRLNEVSNVEELFDNFLEREKLESFPLNFGTRIGSDDGERSPLRTAKMANCIPELKTVPLKPDKSSTTFYYPSCTRVERCGGCCSHHLLSCQPTQTEILPLSVVVADYRGGNQLHFKEKKVIQVEKHVKCKCDCKIRPEDCTRYQRYSHKKCRCECTNSEEEIKCYEEGLKKIWNMDNCSCMCREELECEFGYYFDPYSCRCVPYRSPNKKVVLVKKGFILQ